MQKRRVIALSLILSLLSLPIVAQNGSGDMLSRIRKEAMDHSQIMKTMHMFTDLYGPRLTGSPNHKAAAEWAVKQMTAWGLENAHLEPWDFKHPGWLNERLTAHLISPVKDPLVCEVLAWTPSTKGTVQANAYQLVLPDRVTQDQIKIFFNNYKTKVRGKIVLIGKPAAVPVNLNPPAKRITDDQAQQRFGPNPRPFPTPSPTPTPDPNA
ncbi:MAG TPA: hypothetical protein VFT08_07335, partial [Pyrinomonadaceae bacterium]|nr:hypothetical protein [Pyrinomonadaceae bacterium]